MRLETPRLVIRPWREEERPAFHRLNSDDAVMAFFPFRRTRQEADAVMDKINAATQHDGFGFTALEEKATGICIGMCGLSPTDLAPHVPHGTIEIGWRLLPEHWGNGYASEAAGALIGHAFDALGLDQIIAFAVPENRPSLAVMQRIGMHRDASRDFDHPRVPASHPQLRRHVLHAITRRQWLEKTPQSQWGTHFPGIENAGL